MKGAGGGGRLPGFGPGAFRLCGDGGKLFFSGKRPGIFSRVWPGRARLWTFCVSFGLVSFVVVSRPVSVSGKRVSFGGSSSSSLSLPLVGEGLGEGGRLLEELRVSPDGAGIFLWLFLEVLP